MLTPSGWLTLAVSLAALVVGRLLVLAEVVILAGIGMLLVGVCLLAVWVFCPKTRMRRRHPSSVVSMEESAEVGIQFAKRLWPPLKLPMHVQDTLKHYRPRADTQGSAEGESDEYERLAVSFSIAGRTSSVVYSFNPSRRGIARFGPLRGQANDPFNLARRKWQEAFSTEILVLPPIEDVMPPSLSMIAKSQKEESCALWQGSPSGDFLTLREYAHGDDMRQVHWKSSARTGKLMIRQSEHLRESGALLMLDTRSGAAGEGDFEKMVGAAASLCVACRNHRMPLEVATFLPHLESQHVRDADSLEAVLRMLALVPQSEEALSPEKRFGENWHRRRSAVVLTGSFADSDGDAGQGAKRLSVCFGDQPTAASAMWVPSEARFSDVWNSYFWNALPRWGALDDRFGNV